MADNDSMVPGPESSALTDDEIVTERKLPRRSFLGATGALLTGATGMVLGKTASELHSAEQNDPDKRPVDPDKKPEDPNRKEDDPHRKPEDRRKKDDDDHKRRDDPDKRPADPDRRPADPNKPPDPHRQ